MLRKLAPSRDKLLELYGAKGLDRLEMLEAAEIAQRAAAAEGSGKDSPAGTVAGTRACWSLGPIAWASISVSIFGRGKWSYRKQKGAAGKPPPQVTLRQLLSSGAPGRGSDTG